MQKAGTTQYDSGLPWKGDHCPIGTNEMSSKRRLRTLVNKLRNMEKVEEYNDIIQNQLKEGVVEPVPATPDGKEFYIPHKGV